MNTSKYANLDKDVTVNLQELIDLAHDNKEKLIFTEGQYNIHSLYFKADSFYEFEEGVVFNGILDENYPLIDTRVAGIEMQFYPALINVINTRNVTLKGHFIVNGRGKYDWEKYWGPDTKGGMRKEYDAKGLRAFCDYDCLRVRNILIQNSHNIYIDGAESKDSGFWNLHILYSHDIVIDNVYINSDNLNSPSTDGIDIDSSYNVIVRDSKIKTNDDCIAIKSGRDMDGIRVNVPSHDILVENTKLYKGFGLTIGSEVSGGIYNVKVNNVEFDSTDCGFRIKSSINRKGYIKNIDLNNLKMIDVKYPFHIDMNWNKNYSIVKLPKNYDKQLTDYQKKLLEEVPSDILNTKIENIAIKNVESTFRVGYNSISRAFQMVGFEDSPIQNMTLKNIHIKSYEYGNIAFINNLHFEDVVVDILKSNDKNNDEYDNR